MFKDLNETYFSDNQNNSKGFMTAGLKYILGGVIVLAILYQAFIFMTSPMAVQGCVNAMAKGTHTPAVARIIKVSRGKNGYTKIGINRNDKQDHMNWTVNK